MLAAPLVADDRVARVAFAASPRAVAASADAAREAAVRFDGAPGFASSPVGATSAAAAADGLRVVVFEAAGFAAAVFAAAVFAAAVADAVFAAGDFAVADFAVADFGVAAFAAVGFVRLDDGAAEPEEDARCADAPVSVPSAASSSCSERETEVTQTTYQCPPPERSSAPRSAAGKLGIP